MASFYSRKNSPFYYIRTKGANGEWSDKSSGIRIGSQGAIRKIHQKVAEFTKKESEQASDGSAAAMQQWVPGWFSHHYTNELSKKRAMNCWAHLSTYFALKKIRHPQEVTYSVCHDYMKWRSDPAICEKDERKPGNWNTALTEIRVLGTIMQEAVAQGWIISNPCARLKLGRRDVKEKRAIERDEQEKIEEALKSCPEWMQDSWLVAMKQGCRLSEVKAPLKRVSLSAMAISFRVKGGSLHTAPLHADLVPLVKRRQGQDAEFLVDLPTNASKLWNQWLTNQGFPDLSFHCIRVTVITRFAQANVTAEKAMQYIGHCDEMVHGIYRKLRPKDVASLGDIL
ncbi:phage integrase SAM-like domain-containing protein [Luteolibacter pohnpeiensis]|uniref:Phage integrase SAM-like domain-containing protein n=1 Tax=Luteolibacter pohnpeiensis TaxID=454153 RepID=A0A934S9M2_9BACT|nr:phage integrase SAM-like domain-containing protein [Luteolibacter pohnpeiensis]MBK1884672.1 phage integrase SAM-like domain-containing protein [Luteolibacter pohnpeiensis]